MACIAFLNYIIHSSIHYFSFMVLIQEHIDDIVCAEIQQWTKKNSHLHYGIGFCKAFLSCFVNLVHFVFRGKAI